jgi:hypothetical protein
MFAAGHQPRRHLTAAAKAMLASAIQSGEYRPHIAGPTARPLVNAKLRPFLPVDKDMPYPGTTSLRFARPWALMDVGDSFFEPLNGTTAKSLTDRMKWDAKAQTPKGSPARRYDFIATTENGQPGLRVWRLA